ncbi:MAG: hypothetical protein WC819_05070 [Parcubacteria group bacterium]|jgi:hypothetical protein
MSALIDLLKHIIHGENITNMEEWFVEKTSPLYRFVVFGIIGFAVMIAIGITATVNGFKSINFAFWIISMLAILILLLYGKYIFRVGVAGVAYGATKSGMSGIEAGTNLLKQYFTFGLNMVMVVTGVFGLLTFINFSWTSAGFGIFGGVLIAAAYLKNPKKT